MLRWQWDACQNIVSIVLVVVNVLEVHRDGNYDVVTIFIYLFLERGNILFSDTVV